MHQITAISPENIDTFWVLVKGYLEGAAKRSNHVTAPDIYADLKHERSYLWVVHEGTRVDAAVVAQLELTKRGKECVVSSMGGKDMDKWAHLIEPIEAWAKTEGCTFMRHEGRPGLLKMMKPFGYRLTHITIEKAI